MSPMPASRSIYKQFTFGGVVIGVILLLASVLDDGHVDSREWGQIGMVLFVTCLIGLSHFTRANPRQIREHDVKYGIELGRRLAKRERD